MSDQECVEFDEDADALYVALRTAEVSRTIALDDHRLVDVDENGECVGVEFIDVSGGIDLTMPGFGLEAMRIEELLKGQPFRIFAS